MAGVPVENVASGTLSVTLDPLEGDAGFAALVAENDSGSITGTRYTRAVEVTDDFRVRVAIDSPFFSECFPGVAFNTAIWTQVVATMTATVASGFANLNAGLSTASGAVARLQTWRSFPIYKTFITYAEMEVQFAQTPQANNVCEWGLFYSTGTAAPTDGAFFRLTSTGEFRCILNYNGTETQSAALNFGTLVGVNTTRQFLIYVGSTMVRFWIDNIQIAAIPTPAGQGSSIASMNVPLAFRNYNSGITASAQVMKVGNTNVTIGEAELSMPFGQFICGGGGSSSQGQTGGTMGSTANYANSANPVAAVATNTTAALGSGLGGQFWETDTLAVTTDGIISSYQVPAGTAAVPGKSFYCSAVRISSYVQTVLVGGPYVAQWSLAYGHTAVSLATTETATTKAPRRVPLGIQPVTAAQAVSTIVGTPIAIEFADEPVVVHPGEFIQVVKKKVGTAPSSGVIAHVITFVGKFV